MKAKQHVADSDAADPSISRRSFCSSWLAAGACLGAAAGGVYRWLDAPRALVLRPPGARPEAEFLAACIRCGQCVEACPTGVLHLQDHRDLRSVGTPTFEPRSNPCTLCTDQEAMRCIEACPSDALRPTERADVRIGTATIAPEICLAHNGVSCRACWHACPYPDRAIRLDARLRPEVDASICTGCGLCVLACLTEEPSITVAVDTADEERS